MKWVFQVQDGFLGGDCDEEFGARDVNGGHLCGAASGRSSTKLFESGDTACEE
jgi:hypothetical protein